MDVNKSPFSIGMLTWIKSLTQVNGTQCRTQMWHVWPINHRALWFFTFINYRSEGKYCTAPWPFIHQSSLHAELKAGGDRTEQNDTFWKGGRLNEPWQQSTFRFLKRLSSLPLSMSCPHFTCSVQRNVHAYKKHPPYLCSLQRTDKQAHPLPFEQKDNTLPVLPIWAAYITNRRELCNAPFINF